MSLIKVKSRGTDNVTGRRNILINGAMQVAQRGTQTGQGGAEAMSAVDRFKLFGGSTAGRLTSSQDSDSPIGFGNSLKLDCTTADTSVSAGEFLLLEQRIEGQDLQQLKYNQSSAETSTISFYVKGNASAQYTFALQYHLSGGTARWFTKGFAVTTDWTRVVIPILGDTQASSGSDYGIANNNVTGANLMIWLHGGTNFSSGTHQDTAWADRDYTKLFQDNQTSFYDSTDRTFFITGFQFEIGSQATPFEHRSFGEELLLCRRYYFKQTAPATNDLMLATGNVDGSTYIQLFIPFHIEMRSSPTALEQSGTASDYAIRVTTNKTASGVPTFNAATPHGAYLSIPSASHGLSNGLFCFLRALDTDAFLAFSAEL